MNPLLQPLPYDATGTCPNNRTRGEYHDLNDQTGLPYRVVVLDKGYFYKKDLHIYDKRNVTLKEGFDYQCTMPNPEVQGKTGLAACAVIVIKNPAVASEVYVDARMVGGKYCNVAPAIANQSLGLLNNTRKIHWNNITGKPDDFNSGGHMHALWQLYGFTPQTLLLKRMTAASERMTKNDIDDLYKVYETEMGAIGNELTSIEARLTTHIADQSDPHDITALQVELERVRNADIATEDQARANGGSILDRYATPLRSKQSVESNFLPLLQAHVEDTNNPHKDNATDLGTYTTQQHATLATNYYNRGEIVALTDRLGGTKNAGNVTTYNGETFQELYTRSRTNEIATEIKTGVFTLPLFSRSIPSVPNDFIAVPTASGELDWLSISAIFAKWAIPPKDTIYVSSILSYGSAHAQLASIIGTNFTAGTVAIFRYIGRVSHGTGNGSTTTTLYSIGIATIVESSPGVKAWRV